MKGEIMGVDVTNQVVVNADGFTMVGDDDEVTITVGDDSIVVSVRDLTDACRGYCRVQKIRFASTRQPRKTKETKDTKSKAA